MNQFITYTNQFILKNNLINNNIFQYKNNNKLNKNKYFNQIKNKFITKYKKNEEKVKDKIKVKNKKLDEIEDSYFISPVFINDIQNLTYGYEFQYLNNKIEYYTQKKIKKTSKKVETMFIIIQTIKDLFNRDDCFQKIVFYDLYTKKTLPNKKEDIIGQENCNSAFCTVIYNEKKNGDIVLFRNEELIKVLIHELIHANFVDYQIIHSKYQYELTNNICTSYSILINEAFTETFSSLLHMIYISEKTGLNINTIYENEYKHMIIIFNKIIYHYNIKEIEDILKNNGCKKEFKQKTNVFSYYVLKMLNYKYIDKFLKLMSLYSNKNYSINNQLFNQYYIEFVLKHIHHLNQIIFKKNKKNQNKNIRLTLYEVKM